MQSRSTETVDAAADTAKTKRFDEKTLRLTLPRIDRNSYGDGATVNQALEEDWKIGADHAMADGIIPPDQLEDFQMVEGIRKVAVHR